MPNPSIPPLPGGELSLEELDLYHLLMDYRAANGLPPIELSAALTTTAGYHTHDTLYNIWDANLSLPPGANLHSWSDAPYFADHSQPEVMWFAPDRYGIDYPSAGYEISAAGYASIDLALVGWQGSPGHNNVILNLDAWADVEFLAIGIGVAHDPTVSTYQGNIYHVWFGASVDPAGPPQINGTAGDDAIRGTAFDDCIEAGDGNDRVDGHDDHDSIDGNAGQDTLTGGDGNDTLNGGEGHDQIWAGSGDTGDDSMDGGGGNDIVGGGAGADTLLGGDGQDTLFAGAGDDQVQAGPGSDLAWAGAGDDNVNGGDGNNVLGGGHGNDTVSSGSGDDVIYGGQGTGADSVRSSAGNDTVFSGAGNDTLDGGAGDDLLYNGAGSDAVDGAAGDDTLWGGPGDDALIGGDGADRFAFATGNGSDTISDFESGVDEVALDGTGLEFDDLVFTDTAGGVEVSYGTDSMVFTGLTSSDLGAGDFVFV